MRILTLTPAATEIVCALGCGDQLVGRSHGCDHPESVLSLPAVTQPKTAALARDAPFSLHTHLSSVYLVDLEQARALTPDVIMTTVVPGSEDTLQMALADAFKPAPQLINLEQNEVSAVLANITRVSGVLGVPERGAALMLQTDARLKDIYTRAAEIQPKPTVAALQWVDPLMICGNWVPELITMAGGVTLFGRAGHPSFWIDWDDLWAADPDRIVIVACGYSLDEARAALPALTRQPGWATLRAIRDKQVYITDADQFFSRPSPRLAESLEILAEICHPTVFRFGHEGAGWERF
ncbi:MAG: ABC transporter substrate-binding protein [Anaerolineae bacterium]|nr:ABC transporter substrate-binding protein [Anaerolineae bacterium]